MGHVHYGVTRMAANNDRHANDVVNAGRFFIDFLEAAVLVPERTTWVP